MRTAIGDYGGSLKDIAPTELAARVVREAVSRAKVDPTDIGQCVFGNVIHTETKDMYLSRVACVNGGLPHETGALTLNRLCGSGLQAICQRIAIDPARRHRRRGRRRRREHEPRRVRQCSTQRWGARMGDAKRCWT